MLDAPAAYRQAIPALIRTDIVGRRAHAGATDDRLVEWEMEIPLFNLSGKMWVSSDGQRVVLNENTELKIVDYSYTEANPQGDRMVFDLLRGGARFVTGLLGKRSQSAFQMRTPHATIGIRGTDFMAVIVNPLYVNVAHTVRLSGMSDEESAPLLEFLFRHQVKPELTCRFQWRAGSLAFWDNRCTQHNPVNDYHGHRRVMLRITLAGDKPR